MLVTCTATGVAYVWSRSHTENWSAYAPGFTELEENEDYIEREDEFDEPDTDEEMQAKKENTQREVMDVGEVDIGNSDDEEKENTDVEFLLSTHPIPDYLILAATEQRTVPKKK
eukprot:TRINITY_DN7839_c0_g1_i2.p1 TRINITY_DN7839_c0_g1~~TRINITY_DN7839_c0_g1_i2.p1  ORF type:complete len:114 (-),score=36.42 TRINITY_DN7839_c0_g1_i2:6-347(-)